jgi:hypothetical protein
MLLQPGASEMNGRSTHGEADRRLVEELIDEHVRVDCNLIPIDANTWAIHGSVAVDGNVILAEFDNKDDAEAALERIAAAQAHVEGRIR